MKIHPDILVHWTPQTWAGQKLTDILRIAYVKHLKSILKGLRLSEQRNGEIILGYKTKTQLPNRRILCFSELRLSLVEKHVERYGRLGIGFRRGFLMEHGANPVFYLQNDGQGVVSTNLNTLGTIAKTNRQVSVFLSFMKGMSSPASSVTLDFYDELEWRMVECSFPNGKAVYPNNVFKFEARDVALLVFPDAKTRRKALADQEIQTFFDEGLPMILDAPDVGNL